MVDRSPREELSHTAEAHDPIPAPEKPNAALGDSPSESEAQSLAPMELSRAEQPQQHHSPPGSSMAELSDMEKLQRQIEQLQQQVQQLLQRQ